MMEQLQGCVSKQSRKRKLQQQEEEEEGIFILNELNQDLLERVLSWLPTSSFLRLRSVCKRWSCVAASASFRLACSQVPSREPWFLMVDHNIHQSVVFDTSERNWKHLKENVHPLVVQQNNDYCSNSSSCLTPVAASGGLICYLSSSTTTTAAAAAASSSGGRFVVCNPVTGVYRKLPPLPSSQHQIIHAVAMKSSSAISYNLVLVFGELPNLSVQVYDSGKDCWEDEIKLSRRKSYNTQDEAGEGEGEGAAAVGEDLEQEQEVMYFLSKGGDVVATTNVHMQRSPSKQYSSVITLNREGAEIIYYLSSSGTVMACNPVTKCFYEYPRLLQLFFFDYSLDVVECRGELLVVVLSEYLESASLRVWRFSEEDRSWCQVSVMPPSMSHELYGKKADINCVGSGSGGDEILICVNAGEFNSYLICDLGSDEWIELPKCFVNGKPKEFVSAFSFQPRIETCV